MDICFNSNPRFTRWLAKSNTLYEPFVLVDVGVLGGENPRWHFLGDHLVVHGLDAVKETVDALSQSNAACPNKTFHWFAISDEDGERKFYFNPSNPSNSSFFEYPETQARIVPVRRLDTLLKEGLIPKADFLKVDVEGHERHLFLGANDLLAGGVLGVEAETSFATSVIYPQHSFGLIQALLIKHGLVMSDFNFNRVRRAAYQRARKLRALPELSVVGAGKPATFNVLFCRDPVAELDGSVYYDKPPPSPRVDQILKLMAIYELHGLNDIAVDIAVRFSNVLEQRLDVERAVDLLCDNIDIQSRRERLGTNHRERAGISRGMQRSLAASGDRVRSAQRSDRQDLCVNIWRITAPLRTAKNALKEMAMSATRLCRLRWKSSRRRNP